MKITVFALIDIEEYIGFDVIDEASLDVKHLFYNGFEEESYIAIEIVFYLGLGTNLKSEYRPGKCFWSKNHLFPCYANLL